MIMSFFPSYLLVIFHHTSKTDLFIQYYIWFINNLYELYILFGPLMLLNPNSWFSHSLTPACLDEGKSRKALYTQFNLAFQYSLKRMKDVDFVFLLKKINQVTNAAVFFWLCQFVWSTYFLKHLYWYILKLLV